MNIVTDISCWKQFRKSIQGKTIGFVPTMGNLHAGHLSLCQRSKSETDITIVSIFINPYQFDQRKDFELYLASQDLKQDQNLLQQANVDVLFLPTAETIYPDNFEVQVSETVESTVLEGEYRPDHFTGVLTVVLKLLNLVAPTFAYFGEKDYQQYFLVKKMVESLFLPIEIIPCETIRTATGLALSSRNSRLTSMQSTQAAFFSQVLRSGKNPLEITKTLTQLGFQVEYVAERWNRRLAAVKIGSVRLIDNMEINYEI